MTVLARLKDQGSLDVPSPESAESVRSAAAVLCLFFVLWAYMSKSLTSEHYSAIQTRSSVLEGYLQDGHNEPKKPPSAYWKACVQKILLF